MPKRQHGIVLLLPGNGGDNPTMDFEFTSYSGAGQPLMGYSEAPTALT